MSKIYLFSDPHFGHKNMAQKRGFQDEFYQDEHIVEQWNKTLTKRDVCWILGDITMEKDNYSILDRLNGIKKIVLGNHDMPQHVSSLLKHCNYVCGMFKLHNYILTHAPIHECEINRFSKNIHGHVHENSILKHTALSNYLGELDERYINVSAEAINYTPVQLTSITNNTIYL